MPSRAKDADALAPWVLGVAASLFYLSWHSAYYNFDGVACAIAVELGDWGHLVHGNHLAYGVVGFWFYKLWTLLGYAGPALLPLQVLDSILGGAGVGVFCSLLQRLKFRRSLCVGGATGLAVSQCYWFWSLEAQVYLLGVFFVLLTAREIFSEKPRPIALGVFHAGAILGHVGHAMLFPAVAYRLWSEKAGAKIWLRYLGSLAAVGAVSYALAAIFCVRPNDLEGLRRWFLGSAALTVERNFTWQGGYSIAGLKQWLVTTTILMIGPSAHRIVGIALATVSYASLVGTPTSRKGPRAQLVAACLIWIACYALLFVSWEPFLDVYRISDLIPLWILLCLALERRPETLTQVGLGLWVAAAGIYNATQSIGPRADPANNESYREAVFIARATPENAWIIVTARGQVYVPYFAHRKPLNLRYFGGGTPVYSQALYRRIDELEADGEPIFVATEALESSGWKAALQNYGLELEREEDGLRLYRLRRKGSPTGSSRRS